MADISKVKIPGDNTEYNIKDTTARTDAASAAALANTAVQTSESIPVATIDALWEAN